MSAHRQDTVPSFTEEQALAALDKASCNNEEIRGRLRGLYRLHVETGLSPWQAAERTLFEFIDIQQGGKGDANAARARVPGLVEAYARHENGRRSGT